MDTLTQPKMVLAPNGVYLGDNGRCLCGNCSGMSAKYTGHDISGQRVELITREMLDNEGMTPGDLPCESCGVTP